jgi:hypothetical protein
MADAPSSLSMRRRTVSALVLSVAVASFAAGYWIASARAKEAVALSHLVAVQHYVPAIAHLRKGNIQGAKALLYVAVDVPLASFSQDDAASLPEEAKPILRRLLPHLNEAWAADRPFEGEDWSSLRKMPEWRLMRERNDSFRQKYASDQ